MIIFIKLQIMYHSSKFHDSAYTQVASLNMMNT